MTEQGSPRRLRSRRLAIAAAGTGAAVVAGVAIWGPTETIASFMDEVWASAGFGTGSFGIESSLTNNPGSYTNHSESPLDLTVGTPISLAPGEVAYSGFYIKRTASSDDLAEVRVSGPTGESESSGALWNDHLTFIAKVAPVAGTGTTCGQRMFEDSRWLPLYNSGTLADPEPAPEATFTLGEPVSGLSAGEPYMVCFQFTLDTDIVTEAPGANGESVQPMWTFTAESRQP